jgi:uncharacterized protein involved in exopolysaccharide biosynthesis
MTKSTENSSSNRANLDSGIAERSVYVARLDSQLLPTDDEIELTRLWRIFWEGRWLILGTIAIFSAIAVAYSLFAPRWYTAEVQLAPAEQMSQPLIPGELAGLANMAGLGVESDQTNVSAAFLVSRDFTRNFISARELLPVLFADAWDEDGQEWIAAESNDWPDLRDGVTYFDSRVRTLNKDRSTGLFRLIIEWKDAEMAADWANSLVDRLNEKMRQRTLSATEANIAYLREQLAATNLVTMQQSISRLLEAELQKDMLARGNSEFAFQVIDRAEIAKTPSRPKAVLIIALAIGVGSILGLFFAAIAQNRRPSADA